MLATLGYLTVDVGVRVLPARLADSLAAGIARLLFALRPPARARLEGNLARLDPSLGASARAALARQAFEHFALSLLDFMRLGRLDARAIDRAIEVRGAEHLEQAVSAGRGVILLSAHLGNWEWGAAWLASRVARIHVVARPHPERGVEEMFVRRRGARGIETLAGRPVWPRAARALRRREWLALMGDRPAARTSVCAWAAALSRRTGAVVLPAVMVRVAPGRYAACFEPPLTAEACAAGGYRVAMRRYLEQYPAQWCAFEPLAEGLA
jgi:KDO2-lipid IV(A) lauroyltransferase